MSLIKKSELKQLSEPQIGQKLVDLKRELLKLNSQRATGTTLENPGKIRLVKKTVARLYTRLTEIKSKNVQEAKKASPKKKSDGGTKNK